MIGRAFAALFMCTVALALANEPQFHSVVLDETTNQHVVVPGHVAGAPATGYFQAMMNTTGWGELYIRTNPALPDSQTMYAAGYLEGQLTSEWIYATYLNAQQGSPLNAKVASFLLENLAWTRSMVSDSPAPAMYWTHVGLLLDQFDGMYAGYQAAAGPNQNLSLAEFMSISAQGDIEDISIAVGSASASGKSAARAGSHCSGFVKLRDDLSELYIGHSTWQMFAMMLRIWKYYDFDLNSEGTVAQGTSFSSYPGSLSSIDDFYTLTSNLVVIETTNGCMNNTLYENVTPTTGVLSFIRVCLANRMAQSAPDWAELFVITNSRTYNNQWIVLDYNMFTPGSPIQANTLWILEQFPGDPGYMAGDVSSTLQFGYWPSYNVPYYTEIYNVCDFPQSVKKYGPYLFAYETCARAEIFRRNQSEVYSETQFQAMMRYNDWRLDPLSSGNSGLAISSRFDLVDQTYKNNPTLSKSCFGAIDSKMTSSRLMANGAALAWSQSGPTHDQQPAFDWSAWPNVMHYGMPPVFDFGWVLQNFTSSASEQL